MPRPRAPSAPRGRCWCKMDWAALSANWLPPLQITVLSVVLSQLRFELQRWTRAIRNGQRGSNSSFTAFVLLSEVFVTSIALACLGMIFWFAGWRPTLGLIAFGFILGIVWSVLVGAMLGDNFFLQFLSLLLSWPVSVYLAYSIFVTYT